MGEPAPLAEGRVHGVLNGVRGGGAAAVVAPPVVVGGPPAERRRPRAGLISAGVLSILVAGIGVIMAVVKLLVFVGGGLLTVLDSVAFLDHGSFPQPPAWYEQTTLFLIRADLAQGVVMSLALLVAAVVSLATGRARALRAWAWVKLAWAPVTLAAWLMLTTGGFGYRVKVFDDIGPALAAVFALLTALWPLVIFSLTRGAGREGPRPVAGGTGAGGA